MQNANTQPMEWYSQAPGSYSNNQYQYAPPPMAQHTATAYASFEDEPPLLEGTSADQHELRQLQVPHNCPQQTRALPLPGTALHLMNLLADVLFAELGIDIPSILSKTKAIVLHQMKSSTLDELDFGGALVFLLALGCLHLMVRRVTPTGQQGVDCRCLPAVEVEPHIAAWLAVLFNLSIQGLHGLSTVMQRLLVLTAVAFGLTAVVLVLVHTCNCPATRV